MGWLCGVGVFGLIECPHSLPRPCTAESKIIIIKIIDAFQIIIDNMTNHMEDKVENLGRMFDKSLE